MPAFSVSNGPTNFAVGTTEGLPSFGPREIVVRGEDAEAARNLLTS
jgi:hypothetical protein